LVVPDVQQPRFTAVHRALGIEPRPLDWSLIEQAVSAGVTEQIDLDWKRERHDTKANWHEEFAKDVAAMANSGGGLIVIGVNEDRATSAATGFADPVELTDGDERMFRSTIYGRISPPVAGVTFTRLADFDHAVVVIHIPPSADDPHLIERQTVFGAPFRDGTRTEWMRERQLAAAYRGRFADAAALEQRLATLYDEVTASTYAHLRVCFVGVAVPENPRPTILGRISQETARPIFVDALQMRYRMCGDQVHPLRDNRGNMEDPRQALRRQTARYDDEDDNPKHRSGLGSVHDDGSVSLAWSIGGMLQRSVEGPNELSARFVEGAVADFVALVGSAARALGMDSRYELQAGLVWTGSDPIVIRLPDNSIANYDQDADNSTPIRRFVPARESLDPAPSAQDLLDVARDLALDCVSQAGMTRLDSLRTTVARTNN
jgi:hypothetical protein